MTTPSTLIARARRVLESAAATSLALAPLAAQPAHAVVFDTGALQVTDSGAYFYNASGYFAYWNGQPDGQARAMANADGSTKLFGTASASPQQFLDHQCGGPYGCSGYQERGVALVWSGVLTRPAAVGDRLAITVDFSVTLPDTGGNWTFGARLTDSPQDHDHDNSLSYYSTGSAAGDWTYEAGTTHVHGLVLTDPLADWQVHDGAPIYWKVFVTGTAGAPYAEGGWSDTYGTYLTPYRAVSITVPEHSIDVAHVDANFVPGGPIGLSVSAVPEPATWGMLALGLGLVALRARRRT